MHGPSLVVGALLMATGIASVACNGRVEGDASGSTASKAKRGAGGESPGDDLGLGSTPDHGAIDAGAASARVCMYETGAASSSSGTGGNPIISNHMTRHHYSCDDGDTVQVECSCVQVGSDWEPDGTCSCNGETFPFDCSDTSANAVSGMSRAAPTPDVFERCHVPAAPGSWAGSSSSSSSSSG